MTLPRRPCDSREGRLTLEGAPGTAWPWTRNFPPSHEISEKRSHVSPKAHIKGCFPKRCLHQEETEKLETRADHED